MSNKTKEKPVLSPSNTGFFENVSKEDRYVFLVTVVHIDYSRDDQYVFSNFKDASDCIQRWLTSQLELVRDIKIERKYVI